MFIELVDALRCPVSHEESWLVAATGRMDARHLIDGTLGCPVCSAKYPIRDGVVDFRTRATKVTAKAAPSDPAVAMRLAAQLNLTDAQGFSVLLGEWGNHGIDLAGITETPLLLIDPPLGVTGAPRLSVIRCDGVLPLAAGAARAMAIDATKSADRIASAVRATRATGRILAPRSLNVPTEVRELARDDSVWVGERAELASPLIGLHIRRS